MTTGTNGIQLANHPKPIQSRSAMLARVQKRLHRLRRNRRQQLSSTWQTLTESLAQASERPTDSPPTPQPFALLAQLAEQAEELQTQLTAETLQVESLRHDRDRLDAAWKSECEERQSLDLLLEETRLSLSNACLEVASLKEERDLAQLRYEEAIANQMDSSQLAAMKDELAHRDEQITFLSNEVDLLRNAERSYREEPDSELVANLRAQLLESRKETVELRMQTNDLADQIAKHCVSDMKSSNETLTWEERKKLLLKELEADSEDSEISSQERNQIENIIRTTQSEIDRRDSEIVELRRLLQQQSSAHDGVAVGAAAIAQLLETDELVQNERVRLKELQLEWESKVRQAEVELSRERAKLGRERLEMEAWMQSLAKQEFDELQKKTAMGANSKGPAGNWLSRLGLKEN